MKLLKEEYGLSWMLIFRHKIVPGTEDFLFNEDLLRESTEENRFSLLGNINNSFRFRGKYEFLLEYPEHNGYYRWKQRLNPFTAKQYDNIGYEKIHEEWTEFKFGGITRSSSGCSILDGRPRSGDYYYAIGLNTSWGNNLIPGPFTGRSKPVREVKLWIRINYPYCTFYSKKRINNLILLFVSLNS